MKMRLTNLKKLKRKKKKERKKEENFDRSVLKKRLASQFIFVSSETKQDQHNFSLLNVFAQMTRSNC